MYQWYAKIQRHMTPQEKSIMSELRGLPKECTGEVIDFIRYLKEKRKKARTETILISESSLARDWLKPSEDKAWQNL